MVMSHFSDLDIAVLAVMWMALHAFHMFSFASCHNRCITTACPGAAPDGPGRPFPFTTGGRGGAVNRGADVVIAILNRQT
jgi:hypothetical protein